MNELLKAIKAESERQSLYADTDGEPCSSTSCDASHWLDRAATEIERLENVVQDLEGDNRALKHHAG